MPASGIKKRRIREGAASIQADYECHVILPIFQ
jgi:hypothetical protein